MNGWMDGWMGIQWLTNPRLCQKRGKKRRVDGWDGMEWDGDMIEIENNQDHAKTM